MHRTRASIAAFALAASLAAALPARAVNHGNLIQFPDDAAPAPAEPERVNNGNLIQAAAPAPAATASGDKAALTAVVTGGWWTWSWLLARFGLGAG
jgi:hypothetical protein